MSTHSINSKADEDGSRANEDQEGPRGALAGNPGRKEYVRTNVYNAERHKNTEEHSERVPSAGWRAVYWRMEVSNRGHY